MFSELRVSAPAYARSVRRGASCSARFSLKNRTQAAHNRAEQFVEASFDLATKQGYGRFLALQAQFHGLCEEVLDARKFETILSDWRERRRAHLAAADCCALGARVGEPERQRQLLIATDDHALGLAYVLEGSALGGAILMERVRRAGFDGSQVTNFLDFYGPHRGLMWRRFQDVLEDRLRTEEAVDRAESGASAGFDLFLRLAETIAQDEQTDTLR